MICKYWRELDTHRGLSVEFCSATQFQCACSGQEAQCPHWVKAYQPKITNESKEK